MHGYLLKTFINNKNNHGKRNEVCVCFWKQKS